jgi:aconitate hydratase 2/2-methylisocitrate dehydratase
MDIKKIFDDYRQHVENRKNQGIPPLPLTVEQTEALVELLQNPQDFDTKELLYLFTERIAPGVDPSAKVKADFLTAIIKGQKTSPLISKEEAVKILGTMLGGYNIDILIETLKDDTLAPLAQEALANTVLIYDAFDKVVDLEKSGNTYAKALIKSWADGEWFTNKESLPEKITLKVFKVDGEINTDDFSPASDAWSRPDIPLHALSMGKMRFAGGLEEIAKWREEGHQVAFVGDVVGTGSSRKSATNSLLWHIGQDIPAVPNKRRGGVVIGSVIAPIFFNTVEDSGGFPFTCDVTGLKHGAEIVVDTKAGKIFDANGAELTSFEINPVTLADEFQAGGRIPLIIGKALTDRAREYMGLPKSETFVEDVNPTPAPDQKYTLAQKIVGKAVGQPGVLPGSAVLPKMTTVLSQDTTGPMTADELTELACLKFQSPFFLQSFCHTAAYPKPTDVKMHKTLPQFITERKGFALKPGDGVVHSWTNRFLLPDTVGTGGDSHTRFPIGISFPAGSGLVAFAGALGFMPLNMPESVLVRFSGKLNEGITLRDAVNAIPYWAIQKGLMTVEKKNKKNIFNGRILEIEGLEDLTVEQAFELSDASAERSAAACAIQLNEASVIDHLKSGIALLKQLIADGYEDAETLQNRINDMEEWLKNPKLLRADKGAEYAAVIEIDLSEIKEPIVACPNDPDDVKLLSDVQGNVINDVFIGSCMTNIGHFRAAAKVWEGEKRNPNVRSYIAPPTRMDQAKLKEEGQFSIFNSIGVRIEIPGCSLCMGNQLRVPDKATVFSTSTRNFDNRMGDGAQVYLGSAELAAVVALLGKLPSPEEYFTYYKEKVASHKSEIYHYLQFDKDTVGEVYKIREL